MKRLDDSQGESYLKALVYGPPGTGKTSFVVSAPQPLILLTERQGMRHIRQAAARLGRDIPPTFFCEDLRDLQAVVKACHGDKTKAFRVVRLDERGKPTDEVLFEGPWPKTIGLDSLTDVGQMIVDQIDRESPPRVGADGLPAHTQNFWGVLEKRFGVLTKAFRDLPLNVILTALADDRETGEGSDRVRSLGPSLPMRKLGNRVAAAVNVVGYTYRRIRRHAEGGRTENRIHYGVLTVGPEYAITKPYRPLRDAEIPDFSYWIQVLDGSVQPKEAPAAPGELDTGEQEAAIKFTETVDETSLAVDGAKSAETKPEVKKAKKGTK